MTNAQRQAAGRARRQAELAELRAKTGASDPPEDDPLVTRVLWAVNDGKWHRLSAVISRAAAEFYDMEDDATSAEADVLRILEAIRLRGAYRSAAERRKGPTGWQYRVLLGKGRTIDMDVLMAEIEPLLRGLEDEGRKNMATASPGTVAHLAEQLRRALHKLCR